MDADIILATDPDADLLRIQVKNHKANMFYLWKYDWSLNCRICIFSESKGILPENAALIKTIVTGNISDQIAAHYNARLIEVLTGFKYIGESRLRDLKTGCKFVFGYEESYGYLVGTHSRDKDAVVAVMALCEAAAYYLTQGISLYEQMERIYQKYGYFKEDLISVTLKGIEGMEKIKEIMEGYRKNPPVTAGDYKVLKVRDYKANTITDMTTGKVSPTGLPLSDVLYFELNDDAWSAIRPSGTEPKIKFYFGVKGNSKEDAEAKLEKLMKDEVFKVS